jgi:hypothetical protein
MASRLRRTPPVPATRPHGLAGRLVLSVTSFPPRFPTLSLTLRGLLSQSVRPDATILWVAHRDRGLLPDDVIALQMFGLSIRTCDDLGSYKKIVPLLETEAEAFVATADDDNYYPPNWLETLVAGQEKWPGAIICHTARVVQFDIEGRPKPYRQWPRAASNLDGPLLPTGFGGVLYPPGSLSAEATDRELFMKLSPTADDLWLKWMSARRNTPVHLVTEGRPLFEWPRSQRVNLVQTNIRGGGNDAQIKSLAEHFGLEGLT